MTIPASLRKLALAPLYCLLFIGVCGFFGPNPNKLFDEACKTFPVTNELNLKKKNVASGILKAYGPAAKAGHIESMVLMQFVLENSGQQGDLFPYLHPLESLKPAQLKLDKGNLARIGLTKLPLPEEDIFNIMFSRLSKLHLAGCGTEQSYAKAREVNARVTKSGPAFAPLRLDDKFFADPNTVEAQDAFWKFTRDLPGAELFVVNLIALGDSSAYLYLSSILDKKTPEERLAFYEQHAATAKDFARRAAILYLEKDYSPENLAKARKLARDAKDTPEAKALADCLPESLADTEKLEQTAEYLRKNGLNDPPRWLAAATANKIDAGILDQPLTPGFSDTPSEREAELIQAYTDAGNKKSFLEKTFKTLKDDAPAFRFYVYKDLSERDPKLQTALSWNINPRFMLDKYPPYALHRANEFRARGLKSNANRADFAAAEKLAKEAADQGYPPAMAVYGYMLAFLNEKKDPPKGFDLCLQAARMGDVGALKTLTILPDNGNDKKAREIALLTRAAERGDAEAIRTLASQHNITIAIKPDDYLTDIVRKDNAFSIGQAGLELVQKSGEAPDQLLKGMSLLWYAASKQDVLSMSVLGDLSYSGIIIPRNFERARFYYVRVLKALPPKTCDAIWPVSEMLVLGLGVDQDISRAKRVLATNSCKSDWDEELSRNAIPALSKTGEPHPGFEPRHEPDLELYGLSGKNFPMIDVAEVEQYGQTKEDLLRLLTGK